MNNSETAQLNTNYKVVGSFRMLCCFVFMVPFILGVLYSTYYIAVYREHVEFPYPALSITGTAIHYPQSISFRFGMGCASGFYFLVFNLIFFWIKKSAVEYGYHGCTYTKMYWPTMISINGYALMVGTVDTAGTRMTLYQGVFHVAGAIIFLFFLGIMMLNITTICIFIRRKDSKFMKNWSFVLKLIISGGLLVYIVYQVGMMVRERFFVPPVYRDIVTIGNKIEWVFVVGCPIWMASFIFELKDYRVRLINKKSEPQPIQDKINVRISGEVQQELRTATLNTTNLEDASQNQLAMKVEQKIDQKEEISME